MSKKRCFLCNEPIKSMAAHCITKDGYLICAKDAKNVNPSNHANNFSISLKTSKFINSHTANEIEDLLGIPSTVPYKEHPDLYNPKCQFKLERK